MDEKVILNPEMDGLNKVAKDFEYGCIELNKKITDLKNKAQSKGAKVYLVEFYDGDDSGVRIHEIYSDMCEAAKRFNELIPIVFRWEIKELKLENYDWNNTWEYRSDDLELSHDTYKNYLDIKQTKGEEPSKWYPRNVWRAFNPNGYSELTLRPVEIGNPIINEPKRF